MTDYLFHVHTWRCGHAQNIPDKEYVKKAVEFGYREIWFSDHCPFPGDPFTGRMKYAELDGYISSLRSLGEKYKGIKIYVGTEVEYLPEFSWYYRELARKLDFLLLGQHFFWLDGEYSFRLPLAVRRKCEHTECSKLMLEAMDTGLFRYIAHPDRIFRHCGSWTGEMDDISLRIINSASEKGIKLEMNRESMAHPGYFRKEFWRLVPNSMAVIGADAHCLADIVQKTEALHGSFGLA